MDCQTGQKMWPNFRGDSQEIYCEFKTLKGKGIDVQGKLLTFTMRLNKNDAICHAYDLHFSHRIPWNNDAKQGRVKIDIPHEMTLSLLPGREYYYDFQLSDDDCDTFTEVITAGWGTKDMLRDVTTGVCNDPDKFPTC